METVNALKIRNQLGEVLDRLEKTGAPILISKGRKVRAVLVTLEDFQRRFVDVKAREEKRRFLEKIKSHRKPRTQNRDSISLLRQLRGGSR